MRIKYEYDEYWLGVAHRNESAAPNEYWLHLDEFHLELLILPAIKCVESSLIVIRKSARQRKKKDDSNTDRVSSERFTQDYVTCFVCITLM